MSTPAPVPTLPPEPSIWADGALTVRQAVEFSSLPRSELFDLMRAGVLTWFRHGKNQGRRLSRRQLVEVLERMHAAHKRDKRKQPAGARACT